MSELAAVRRRTSSVYLLFFFSGITGLVYEVIWTRMFAIVFGATAFAISTVLAAFMAGLALGSFYFGRFIDKRGNPLKVYAYLEISIGVYVIMFPFLISLLDRIYVIAYQAYPTSFLVTNVIKFLLSFMVLIIPTTLMGGTLPVLSKFVVTRQERLGSSIGSLYSINTIGGAIGCFVAGFILIASVGIRWSIYITAGVNIAIGAAALMLCAWRYRGYQPALEEEPSVQRSDGAQSIAIRLMIVAFGLSGFAALAYEVLWTRVLSMILGTTVYAFSIMLTAFLCGLALGSFISSRFIDRIKHLVTIFGTYQIAIGCFGAFSVFIFSRLPLLFLRMFAWLGGSWRDFTFIQFIIVFLVMLIPTILMGAIFPVVSRICTRQMKLLGRSIGNIYSANTVGAILGSLAAGFLLIPLIGLQNSIKLIASINILVGLSALIGSKLRVPGASRKRAIIIPVAVCLVILVLVAVPSWNRKVLANGVYFEPRQFFNRNSEVDLHGRASELQLLYYSEGIDSTVAVFSRGPEMTLSINGMPLASTLRTDITLLGMMGYLPVLLHGAPESVLVIGLGAGVTSGMSARYESVARVDCVELERRVVGATRLFSRENREVLDSPKLSLIIDDGRNYLQKTTSKYDVITSDPIHPWLSGAGSLYAVEHFQSCKARLNKGGVVAQWLPLYEMPERDFKTVIRTFQEVFPHTSLWLTDSDAILIGTEDRLRINYRSLMLKFQDEEIQNDMRMLYVDSVPQFLTFFMMGEDRLSEYAADARLNTDDHPILEFSAPEGLYSETVAANLESISREMEPVTPFLYNLDEEARQKLMEYFEMKKEDIRMQIRDVRTSGE
jgi:spermidine synthase